MKMKNQKILHWTLIFTSSILKACFNYYSKNTRIALARMDQDVINYDLIETTIMYISSNPELSKLEVKCLLSKLISFGLYSDILAWIS